MAPAAQDREIASLLKKMLAINPDDTRALFADQPLEFFLQLEAGVVVALRIRPHRIGITVIEPRHRLRERDDGALAVEGVGPDGRPAVARVVAPSSSRTSLRSASAHSSGGCTLSTPPADARPAFSERLGEPYEMIADITRLVTRRTGGIPSGLAMRVPQTTSAWSLRASSTSR